MPEDDAPVAAPSTSGGDAAAAALREEGNAEFRAGRHLRAAALYSRALKAAPDDAALWSNRSAALLLLGRNAKALADADAATRLAPAWGKGWFRRGAALEAAGRLDEALEAYRRAAGASGPAAQAEGKVRTLSKLLRQRGSTPVSVAAAPAAPLQGAAA
jgi:tetratricopeptide (TPR) repeat protein